MNPKDHDSLAECVRAHLQRYHEALEQVPMAGVYDMVIGEVEKAMIQFVLEHSQGNQTRAAEMLGINRNTLRKKMLQYHLAETDSKC